LGEEAISLQFELHDQSGRLAGALICGEERIPFASVELTGDEVTFYIAQSGGRLHGKIERVTMPDTRETFPAMRGDYTLQDGHGGTRRFWIEAVHMAQVVQKDYPDDPEDATELWGTWHYRLIGPGGKVMEAGRLELTRGKKPREEDFATMSREIPPSPSGGSTLLRGVGSKFPQTPSDAELERWMKSGKQPTKADIRTVEGLLFSRFDGQQALSLSADLQKDGTLQGRYFQNGDQLKFQATRAKR
jgi:hypothetical protein